jgi:hypothetical protein
MKTIFFTFLRIFKSLRLGWLRLRGLNYDDIHDQRIVTLKSWEEYCEGLKTAGAAILYPGAPRDPDQVAEGIRYLSRLTRAGLEAFIEYGDPKFPVLRHTVNETIKMGADNPDNVYLNAQINGEYEYRLTGKRNTIHYLGLFTQNGNYGSTGGLSPCDHLEQNDIQLEDDGTFEVILSKEQKGKNWLRMEKDTSLLMVRQTYADRDREEPAEMKIEAIDISETPGMISAKQIDEGLNTAGLFTSGAAMLFSKWAKGFQKHSNKLPLFDPEVSNAAGGDRNIIYYHSHWKLQEEEALLIKVMPPRCDTWNFQLNNYWMESLDYRYHSICINGHQAHTNEDQSITIIVAHSDPNHPNWIQTAGHFEGTMCWRWYRPEMEYPKEIPVQKMKFEEMKSLI